MKTHIYQSPPHNIKSPRRPDAGELCVSVGFTRTKAYDNKYMCPQGITVRRPYDVNSYSWLDNPSGPSRFRYHTKWRTTVGRTPLDGWSARRRDLYLTTPNNHKRKTTMPPEGFEPAIRANERMQTHAFGRTATGIGPDLNYSALARYPCYKYSQQPDCLFSF